MIEIGWMNPTAGGLTNFMRFELGKTSLPDVVANINSKPGQSVYFRASTVTGTRNAAKDEDFVSAPGIWGDLDTPEHVSKARNIRTILRPNGIVTTGRIPHLREQIFFRANEPIKCAELVRSFNKRLNALYGGDKAVVNPTRLMRLPGTIAWPWKAGRVPELTLFTAPETPPPAYPLATMASQLPQEATPEAGHTGAVGAGAAGALPPRLATPCPSDTTPPTRYAGAALDGEIAALLRTAEGSRNNALNVAAVKLGSLVGAGALPRQTVEAELTRAALAIGLTPTETAATIRSGLAFGASAPRQLTPAPGLAGPLGIPLGTPPLQPHPQPAGQSSEKVGEGRSNCSKRKTHSEDMGDPPAPGPGGTSGSVGSVGSVGSAMNPHSALNATASAEQDPDPETPETPDFPATPFRTPDPAAIPPRRWLYGKELIRGFVSVLGSPGGTGKTAYTIGVGLSVATGRPLLAGTTQSHQARVHTPGNVWFYNLEDPLEEMERRIAAALLHYRIPPAEIAGKLFADSGRDRPLIIAGRDQRGNLLASPIAPALVAELRRRAVKLLIVDPFVQSHSAEENRNEEMNSVMALWGQVSHQADVSLWLAHHFRKGGTNGDGESFRGAGAIQGAARVMTTLGTMTAEEADKLGVEEDQRRQFIRLDSAKSNMAVQPDRATWLRLVSVNLGNGTDEYPDGDSVQVIEPWAPPSPWDGMPWEIVLGLLKKLEDGPEPGERYALAKQAGSRWAGKVVIDIAGKTEKRASAMLKAWKENGVLEEKEYMSNQKKKVVSGLEVNQVKVSEMRRLGAVENRG